MDVYTNLCTIDVEKMYAGYVKDDNVSAQNPHSNTPVLRDFPTILGPFPLGSSPVDGPELFTQTFTIYSRSEGTKFPMGLHVSYNLTRHL